MITPKFRVGSIHKLLSDIGNFSFTSHYSMLICTCHVAAKDTRH
jgi:hypothetical protein